MNETTKNSFVAFKALLDKRHIKSTGDTYFDIPWSDFLEIIKAYGFKSGYCKEFTGTGILNPGVREEEIIFFHEEKGLILHAVSFDGKYVNSAKVYGELKIRDKFEENQFKALNGCSYRENRNGTISFNVDARQGFLFHLNALAENFEFSKFWTKIPFLYFLNYIDTKKPNNDYEEITKQKIDASTPEVHKIIFG